MGKDAAACFFRAFNAHVIERAVTELMESHARVSMKAKYGKDFEVVLNQGAVNAVLLKLWKGFAEHFDHDLYNTLLECLGDSDFKGGPQQAPLPRPDKMCIITLVFCGPEGMLKPGESNYQLDWTVAETRDQAIHAETGHNYVTVQIGLDADCVHDGKAIARVAFVNNCWRLTISLRGYCNPTVNYKAWEKRSELGKFDPTKPLIGDNADELIFGVLRKFQKFSSAGRRCHCNERRRDNQ